MKKSESIEGIPVIIRFKTFLILFSVTTTLKY